MDTLLQIAKDFFSYFLQVLSYPIQPSMRIFYLYLLSSLVFAIGVYLCSPAFKDDRQAGRSFLSGLRSFLFPKSVWSHPSAWVDIRFFVPHQLVRLWLYTDVLGIFAFGAHGFFLSGARTVTGRTSITELPPNHTILVIVYALCSVVVIDFVSFVMHYLQHKIPLLWEFHKVHHSAEVLHPLSNYREHPVDIISYSVVTGLAAGTALGVFQFLFGVQPLILTIPVLGVGVFAFAFNFLGYNLRHSHIWVRWPGFLAYLFSCPAHHQIHHSCKPHHINKNIAFMFPIWDILFGTYYLSKQQEELKFGIGDGTENQYRSFVSIYALPFKSLYQRFRDESSADQK